jgi:hypothetical protein
VISAELHWMKVEVLTVYQRVTGEIQVRGRLSPTLNDPEPTFHLRSVATEPLLPGAPKLQNIPDGLFRKPFVGAVVPLEVEPPSPDESPEKMRRYVFFQGSTFNVRASVEFPPAADPHMHTDMLLKGAFFHVVDATFTAVGAEGQPWTHPHAYLNRDLMVALYLG